MAIKRSIPYTIGFFTTGTNSEFSSLLAHMVTQAAKDQNINLIHFLGGSLNPQLIFSQYKYQYQCNESFNFVGTSHLDGIILASEILSAYFNSSDLLDFYSQFKPTPMVSLGTPLSDLPSVYTDHKNAFNTLVSHLIQTHHRKKIAFISGPSSNQESFERYLGYIIALAENDITYNPNYVYVGDFTSLSAKSAIHTLLDERHLTLDAIVCANDSMALTVISELKKRHILIPDQIMVTGCDNTSSSAFCVPSLTSIEPPLKEMAQAAIKLLLQAIEGKNPNDIIIPSTIIYRESCSCSFMPYTSSVSTLTLTPTTKSLELANCFLQRYASIISQEMICLIRDFVIYCYELIMIDTQNFESSQILVESFLAPIRPYLTSVNLVLNLKNLIASLKTDLLYLSQNTTTLCYIDKVFNQITHELLNTLLNYCGFQADMLNKNFSFTKQFLLSITHRTSNKIKQLQSIIPILMDCGITSCFLYLYPDNTLCSSTDSWQMPEEVDLYTGFINGEMISSSTLPLKVKTCDVSSYGFENRDKCYTSYIHPIFFDHEQLGVMVLEMNVENYPLINNLTLELGCALKLLSTFTTQRQIENHLETLSQTDELTGLLNRRGFFNLAQAKYHSSLSHNQGGILFYADMDDLKTINDTYGHSEGDYAIIAMSHLLRDTFSTQDVIGRIGGDEFVILSTNQSPNYTKRMSEKLEQLCTQFNALSSKSYDLSISIGSIVYSKDTTDSLKSLLSKADLTLYNVKRLKKLQS